MSIVSSRCESINICQVNYKKMSSLKCVNVTHNESMIMCEIMTLDAMLWTTDNKLVNSSVASEWIYWVGGFIWSILLERVLRGVLTPCARPERLANKVQVGLGIVVADLAYCIYTMWCAAIVNWVRKSCITILVQTQ